MFGHIQMGHIIIHNILHPQPNGIIEMLHILVVKISTLIKIKIIYQIRHSINMVDLMQVLYILRMRFVKLNYKKHTKKLGRNLLTVI